MASNAGSSVSPAPSMMAIPIARAGPMLWYRPNSARATLDSAAITVKAEKLMDSPTRVTDRMTASGPDNPRRNSSRTRNTRKTP